MARAPGLTPAAVPGLTLSREVPRRLLVVSLEGPGREITHCIVPKRNKWAHNGIVGYESRHRASLRITCPQSTLAFPLLLRLVPQLGCISSLWPTAPAAPGLRTRVGVGLWLYFSDAVRSATIIYFQITRDLKYNANLVHPQGKWECSLGSAPHLALLSWSSEVALSHAACLQARTNVRYCVEEPDLVRKQLSRFLKANWN